jgi:hypothetical protein
MAKIQPVQIWKDGQVKTAEEFNLISNMDNLSSAASFRYGLCEATTQDSEGNEIIGEEISSGNLYMTTQEYQDWDNSNEQAYAWAAQKLSLVIIP